MGGRHFIIDYLNRSSKFWVSLSVLANALVRRDLFCVLALIGGIWLAFATKQVKKCIDGRRPPGGRKTSPGMPSSHALMSSYFAAVHGLEWASDGAWQWLGLFGLGALAVAWLRVAANDHTVAQVAVGVLAGACAGGLWFFLLRNLILGWLESSEDAAGTTTISQVAVNIALLISVAAFVRKFVRKWLKNNVRIKG